MSFLDDAISKTKEVFDVACKKTDEVVSHEKSRINIIALKTKCEKDYAKLGELYYKLLKGKEDISKEEKELVEAIDLKRQEINRLQAELDEKYYDLICPKCQKRISSSSIFCPACGEKIG